MSAALDVATAKRLAATLKATKAGETDGISKLQDEVKDLAVEKMNKWEKRKYLTEKWESAGGVVSKTKQHWRIAEGIKKKSFQREVKKFEEERALGLTGGKDPRKQLRMQKDLEREKKRQTDPFAKNMKLQSVGRRGKDGVLSISKQDMRQVNRAHRQSKKDKVNIEKVFR
jgi:hypothetical protein